MQPGVIDLGTTPTLIVEGAGFSTAVTVDLGRRRAPRIERGFAVAIGDTMVDEVRFVDGGTLTLRAPAGLTLGRHAVRVTTPGGASDTLDDALEVRARGLISPGDAGVDVQAPDGRAGVVPGDSGADTAVGSIDASRADASVVVEAGGGDVRVYDAGPWDATASDVASPPDAFPVDAGACPGGVCGPCTLAAGCQRLVIPASVADCIDPGLPDPDFCEIDTAPGEMAIDALNASTGTPLLVFLRFDLNLDLTGSTLSRVRLRLHTTLHPFAPAPASGEVWAADPFTRPDLFVGAPAPLGTAPLAPDLGAVAADQVVEWDLPPGAVRSPGALYLVLIPTSEDGANYYNLSGAFPPVLELDVR